MLSYALGACLALLPAAGDTSEKHSDSWITMKARLALVGVDDVKSNHVHVDTDNGVVTIYGKVPSAKARSEVDKAIGKIDGVKKCEDLTQIVPESTEKKVSENDSELKKQIENKLGASEDLKGIEPKSVDKGVVVLGGKARDLPVLVHAVNLIDRMPGVRRIETKVKVEHEGSGDKHAGYTPIGRSGQEAKDMSSQTLADAWLTTQVKLKLISDENIPMRDVHVDTWDGVVTVWGKVDSEKAKSEATKDAEAVPGVTRVHNELAVDSSIKRETVADKDVANDVKRILSNHSINKIDIDVNNGVVKLSGKVDSQGQKIRAAFLSREAKGARAVKNDLEVEGAKRQMDIPPR